jgi:cytochrome c
MNAKAMITALFVLAGASTPTFSQQAPPESEKSNQIVVLVNKAAALIDSKGKSAFSEFRKTGSEWFSGDIYLFSNDLKGMELFNAAFPKLDGTDVSGLKDPNGKLLVAEMIKVAQSKGSGWVDYKWPKPGHSQPSQKWSYVKAVTIDGTPALVGAGFYP